MSVVAIHSFRGGTGKSNTVANISAVLAQRGYRVGVIDTDIVSPGIHVLFGVEADRIKYSLNDYLWGKCDIEQTAIDVTARLARHSAVAGQVYLIPASLKAGEIARILREGYDVGLLNDGFHMLIERLRLDVLMIDTHPGLNEETLLSIAIADVVVIIMRPDSQDYQGTGVTLEVARRLDVPDLLLAINKVPAELEPAQLKARVEQLYKCEVVGVVPHSDEMMLLGSSDIFTLRHPDHPVSRIYRSIADRVARNLQPARAGGEAARP